MTSFLDMFQLILSNVWLFGGTFLLVLSILVFVHEWGHYAAARLCGVRVSTFSIGFGKELFGWNDKNGTRWKFSLIPLGGYVQMYGDSDPASARNQDSVQEGDEPPRPMTAEERKVAFFAKPVYQRAFVVFAGPAVNFIFAILILAGVYMTYGRPLTPPTAVGVVKDSAAYSAGFMPHDRVLSIDGEEISRFEDIRKRVLITLDTPMTFVVERGGKEVTLTATPKREKIVDRFGFEHEQGVLGLIGGVDGFTLDQVVAVEGKKVASTDDAVSALKKTWERTTEVTFKGLDATEEGKILIVHPIASLNQSLGQGDSQDAKMVYISEKVGDEFVKYGPLRSVWEAVKETKDVTVGTLQAIGQIFTGARSATELGGLIRIGTMAGDMAAAGIVSVITFMALLSINLGLINLFPIPVLDGGHLVFYAMEAVRGKPVPEKIQDLAFQAGFTILIALMVFSNLSDILQLIL